MLHTRLAKQHFSDTIVINGSNLLLCSSQQRPNPSQEDMVVKPARDQRTPSQSHSSGSYLETGMGLTERLNRNGWEPFGIPVLNN